MGRTRSSSPAGRLAIPPEELVFRASRSGGPGGQHVNTSSTRAEVRWNVAATRALSEEEKARVLAKLAARIDTEGWLRVVESSTRSQLRNREAATLRLADLVAHALIVPRPRKKTRVPKAAKARRLEAKRHRSAVKDARRRVEPNDA
jgi:ribosome-associated protein